MSQAKQGLEERLNNFIFKKKYTNLHTLTGALEL